MNKLAVRLLAACAVLFAIACAPKPEAPEVAAPDPAAENEKLRAESLIWFEHYAKADGPAMGNLYAEDALLMPPGHAPVQGRAAIAEFLGNDAATAKSAGVSIKNKEVTGSAIAGDTGWISGPYEVVDSSGSAVDSGNYLSVHHRINGHWLYIRDTWNSDRAPAAPAGAPATK